MSARTVLEPGRSSGHVVSGGFLERFFKLSQWNTTAGTEMLAGLTTFMVMAYIIFVNPTILTTTQQAVGRAGITTATCLAAGVMTILMGLYTNRAYALAPGMGINAIVAFQLVGAQKLTYAEAMGVIVSEGVLITLLVVLGVRKIVMDAIPLELKRAISVGIGFFILFIGLNEAGIVTSNPPGQGTPLQLGHLVGWPVAVAVVGLLFTIVLMARDVRGSLLWGVLGTTFLAIVVNAMNGGTLWLSGGKDLGIAKLPTQWVATPDFSTLGAFSFGFVAKLGLLSAGLIVLSLMLADFFDTLGTLIGVGGQANYLTPDGQLPDANKPLLVDSLAAVAGGASGASSVTTYIESAAGVGVGGRTGLTAVVTGVLFLLAMPFWPLVGVVPKEATAPALILVGFLMTAVLTRRETIGAEKTPVTTAGIDFGDLAVGLSALAIIIMMPLTYNITNGIGAGFILYTVIRVVRGEGRRIHPALYLFAAIFVVYFLREALFGITA